MSLVVVGINHRTAPVDVRERVVLDPARVPDALRELASLPPVQEAVIVSTCNRTELYCVTETGDADLGAWLQSYHQLGASIHHCLYLLAGLDAVLKTGKPNRTARNDEAFILGMHNLALLKVKNVLAALDLRGVKRVLDLGGGPGTYAMAFARQGKEAVIMDFPETLKIAKRLIAKEGLGKKISLLPGISRAMP